MTLYSPFTCNDANNRLNTYVDGESTDAERQAIEQHLQHCSACHTTFTQRRQLLEAMKSMPSPVASPDLSQRILEARAKTNTKTNTQTITNAKIVATTDANPKATTKDALRRQKFIWFSAGATSALAASLLLFAATLILKPLDASTPSMSAVIDSLHVEQNINFVVHSNKALDNVRFSVAIPSNIQLKGYSGLRELAWNGKLIKGDNLLSLPVIANNAVPGVMVMRVMHQGAEKEYRINVNIDRGERLS